MVSNYPEYFKTYLTAQSEDNSLDTGMRTAHQDALKILEADGGSQEPPTAGGSGDDAEQAKQDGK